MRGDVLIKNALLWRSVDRQPEPDSALLVRDGVIAGIGLSDPSWQAREVIDAGGRLLMPGLIQTHIHLCQTLFRGAAEDLPLLPWLRQFIWPLEAAHDPASLRASALLSCAELIRTGTTAFMSMETVRHTGAVFEAVESAGLMGAIGQCFMDDTGGYAPLSVDTAKTLADCDTLLRDWGRHDRLKLAIAPRFALSCGSKNMIRCVQYAREHGLLLHTHASEQIPEVEQVRSLTGMHNIDYLHSVGLTGSDVGLAHCVHTRQHERQLIADTHTSVLHCPSANLKLGSGIAPIPEYLAMGINVSMGADGAPCNNRLDGFLEMREAGLIQKPRLGPDEALSARDVVRLATINGAKTLGWDRQMGELEEGRLANLILVDLDHLHAVPCEDVATNLIYSCLSSDVKMTMCRGKILFENGRFTTIDEEALKAEVRRQRAALFRRAGL